MILPAILIMIAALAVLLVGLYMAAAAHRIRREADRQVQRTIADANAQRTHLIADAATERAKLLDQQRDLQERLMHLVDRPFEGPRRAPRELVIPDPWGDDVDPNPETGFEEPDPLRIAASGAV